VLIMMGFAITTLMAAVPALMEIMNSGQPDVAQLLAVLGTTMTALMVNGVVLVLVEPFATGATMYAYEDVFGTRRTPAS
jgi:hypothetical protein